MGETLDTYCRIIQSHDVMSTYLPPLLLLAVKMALLVSRADTPCRGCQKSLFTITVIGMT